MTKGPADPRSLTSHRTRAAVRFTGGGCPQVRMLERGDASAEDIDVAMKV